MDKSHEKCINLLALAIVVNECLKFKKRLSFEYTSSKMFLHLERIKEIEPLTYIESPKNELKKNEKQIQEPKSKDEIQEIQPKKTKSENGKKTRKPRNKCESCSHENKEEKVDASKSQIRIKKEDHIPRIVVPKYRNLDSETLSKIQSLKIDSNTQKLSTLRRINKWKYQYLNQFDY